MPYTDALFILSTSKVCNRLDQFLRLLKGDICAHNPLIFSSHKVRSSYSGRSTRSAGHVGSDDENYRKVLGGSFFRAKLTSLLVLLKTCLPLKRKLSLALHNVLVLVFPILLIMHKLKINAFVFKLGSRIELRFPVLELDAQGPELDAKISLPSWAPML